MTTQIQRQAFDEAIAAMAVMTSEFHKDYVFYLHILAQCRVSFDENMMAAAGVAFHHDHYTLYINPKEVIYEGPDKDGKHCTVLGFSQRMPIAHRVGILKHEMLHIILRHIERKEDREHEKCNIAADCSLNQEIPKKHLPDYAIYPDNNFPAKKQPAFGLTMEDYYDLIDSDQMKPKDDKGQGQGQGSGNGDAKGEGDGQGDGENDSSGGSPGQGDPRPGKGGLNHDKWLESEGDQELQQELTKRMTEKAATETQKSAGRLPANYAQIIENLTKAREVCWKQVLRRIVGNKKVNTRRTLMRRDRRLPNANWIKGKTKDRIFDLGVISDVSGSVSDKALHKLWGEIINICDTYNTPVTVVQVDTQPMKPEELTKKTKKIERKACGGTILAPAIEMFKESRVHYDALVVTTDNYLWEDDIKPFLDLKVPVIWLVEPGGRDPFPEQLQGNQRYIKLKEWE